MNGESERSCYFMSVAVLVTASGEQIVFFGDPEEGYLSDSVSTVSNGFGWSPVSKIFVPKNYKNPLSELSTDEIRQLDKQEKGTSALSKVSIWFENNHSTIFNK